MFSGIIQSVAQVVEFIPSGQVWKLKVAVPTDFLKASKTGDSIAFDGICLTLEEKNGDFGTFSVGPETLKITQWQERLRPGVPLNVEHSLSYGDPIHGHLVTGHVDALGTVSELQRIDDVIWLVVELPQELAPFVWKKGSVAINGVSLTVNKIIGTQVSVCLVPETVKRTNLSELKEGGRVNVEVDNLARGLVRQVEVNR